MAFFDNFWKNLSGAGSSVASGLGNVLGNSVLGMFGVNQPKSQPTQQAMPMQQISSGSLWNSPYQRGAPNRPATPGVNAPDIFGSTLGRTGAGFLTQLFGQKAAPKVERPDFSSVPSVQNYRNFSGATLPTNVEGAINRSVDIQHEQENRRLRDVYKNARPGTDYLTDSAYQRDLANLERRQTLNRSDAQAMALSQFNQQELEHLGSVADLDIGEIMYKLNLDAQEAEDFKNTFSKYGSMMVSSGLGEGGRDYQDELTSEEPQNKSVLDRFLRNLLIGGK